MNINYGYQKQQGVALVISLIILLMLTLVAVSGMTTTILEEKMAGNFKDRNTAFEAAEASLRAGENYLKITPELPIFDGSGLYQPAPPAAANTAGSLPIWTTIDWKPSSIEVKHYADTLIGVSEKPAYIIEELQPVNEGEDSLEAGTAIERKYYRVTSRAVGNTDTAVVILQTTYKR